MSEITLEKGRLSPDLLKRLRDYYRALVDPEYLDNRWARWRNDPRIVRYVAKKADETAAWVVYDPRTSMIEEMLTTAVKGGGEDLLPHVMDALIARESLVAAEILERDKERYRWMVEYGFRPTRRFAAHGLSFVRMELSTAVYLRRFRRERPVKAPGRELVAIERVPPAQTREDIAEALGSLIRRLGGLERFVAPGGTVVIKPNIVSDHGMKGGAYTGGIVTDIRLVEALIKLLRPVAGSVIVAEGSSINRSETKKMFGLYGYDRLADIDRRKVHLVDLNMDRLVEKRVPGGKRMASRKVPLTMERADTIINLPVLKIHFAAVASLAMKNLQGAMPPLEKYMSHFFGLWQSLVNIHLLIKPGLTVIDGLTGLEDFGPVSGRPKPMNLLIGGTNPVAVDSVAMRVMGLDPASSPLVLLAHLQGLGPIEHEKIRVAGASIEEVASTFVRPEINLQGGHDLAVHNGRACPGCSGYLHFVLSKLKKPDPRDRTRMLIDRPFEPKVHVFLGPSTDAAIEPGATNLFMGICQQHHEGLGTHMPGCPPHAEVIMNAVFNLFPDVETPKYADETEEAKLGRMLEEVLSAQGR
jgi:uncharacterized protein (DUF362 family)